MGDVAVRESGNIEAVIEMAIINNRSIVDKLAPGTPMRRAEPANRRVMNYYNINDIYPATLAEADSLSGIGYMAVDITFIVS